MAEVMTREQLVRLMGEEAPAFDTLGRAVAETREAKVRADELVEQCRAALEQTPEAQQLKAALEQRAAAVEAVEQAEGEMRNAALKAYLATGNKRYPGVLVKVGRRLVYGYAEALKYALSQMPSTLRLDNKLFDKMMMPLVDAGHAPPFIKVEEVPTSNLASKIEIAGPTGEDNDQS